jgi:hypothetical protein
VKPDQRRPVAVLKTPGRGSPTRANGSVTSGWEAERSHKGGAKEIVAGETNVEGLGFAPGDARVGVTVGLTIPGPRQSYMMARVDAHCTLPCEANEESVNRAFEKATELAQARLENISLDVKKFFDEA